MRVLPVPVAVLILAVLLLVTPVAGVFSPADTTGMTDAVEATDATDPVGATGTTAAIDPTDTLDGSTRTGSAADSPPIGPVDGSEGARAIDGPTGPASVHGTNLTLRVLSTSETAVSRIGSHDRNANLGTALGIATADADAALRTETTVQRVESAETSAERQRRILAAIDRVERGEAALDERQTAAIRDHAAGDRSDRELLDELVRIAAVAGEYDRRLDRLDDLAADTDGFSSPNRVDELRLRLQVYGGPVRDRALETVRGDTPGAGIHVESSRDAVVLATIDGDEYVRESFRRDRWDREGNAITSETAIDVAVASYPETTALRQPDAFGAGAIQRITVPHEYGTLRSFVSGGTERVFVEHQRIDLDTFPDRDSVSTTSDGFDVTVNRTYPGGPVTVTVRDESSGEPVPGVTVTKSVGGGDSEAIGTTDGNGTVRTVSPAETYRITVVDEPRAAFVDDIRPMETPRLADDDGS